MTGQSGNHEGVKAYVGEQIGGFTVQISICRVRTDSGPETDTYEPPFLFFPPTHILHMGPPEAHVGSYQGTRMWKEIDDPAAVQDPTLILQAEEARALLDALMDHFQLELPSPVILNFKGTVDEETLNELRQSLKKALQENRPRFR